MPRPTTERRKLDELTRFLQRELHDTREVMEASAPGYGDPDRLDLLRGTVETRQSAALLPRRGRSRETPRQAYVIWKHCFSSYPMDSSVQPISG